MQIFILNKNNQSKYRIIDHLKDDFIYSGKNNPNLPGSVRKKSLESKMQFDQPHPGLVTARQDESRNYLN